MWLISCILFVFLALIEYFIVLFGIRYDKHWRTAKTITKAMASNMSSNEIQVSTDHGHAVLRDGFVTADELFALTETYF